MSKTISTKTTKKVKGNKPGQGRTTTTSVVNRDTSAMSGKQAYKLAKQQEKTKQIQAKGEKAAKQSKQRTIQAVGNAAAKNIGATGTSVVGGVAASQISATSSLQSTIDGGVNEGKNNPTGTDLEDKETTNDRDLWG